jgi:phthalate 4,5-dioxygenase
VEAVMSAALKAVHENNEIMTRVGAGTPMGDALRRFWIPALLSDELKRDGAPARLRILGEDLVSFRDSDGRVGVVDAFCAHKRAPLFFGRNEKCGLRCVYHGWKYDVNGQCLDIPNIVPPDNYETLVKRMSITAYDTEEAGGVVWVYMGPKDKKPALPRMEWMELPPEYVHVSRWLQRSNWLQMLEGELDSSHISFLHVSDPSAGADLNRGFNYAARDGRPTIFIRETDYGFFYAARRTFEDQYYWRISHFLQPVWSSVSPASPENYYCNGRGACPVDDYNTVTFSYRYRVDRPLDDADMEEITSGRWFPPQMTRGTVEMPNGYCIDTFLPTQRKGNDYRIDRELQRTQSFSGIFGINTQDRAIQ